MGGLGLPCMALGKLANAGTSSHGRKENEIGREKICPEAERGERERVVSRRDRERAAMAGRN